MNLVARFERLDKYLTAQMAAIGVTALRISLGIVFFWFGFLKFFPGMSSAEILAINTTRELTFGLLPDQISIWMIAALETIIGIGLIFGISLRVILFLLWAQMIGTLAPLVLFPTETFKIFPWVPTLEGQYIIKNMILISAAIVVGATVRGGRLIPVPENLASTALRGSSST
jgi:uncharacterized membrane protein YphA (DoxX/SURF4 family)